MLQQQLQRLQLLCTVLVLSIAADNIRFDIHAAPVYQAVAAQVLGPLRLQLLP